jgi:hypothetical protein
MIWRSPPNWNKTIGWADERALLLFMFTTVLPFESYTIGAGKPSLMSVTFNLSVVAVDARSTN